MARYYVNYKNQFGKSFTAKTHEEALAYATGYAYAKDWKKHVNVYCQSTGEYLTRRWSGYSPKLVMRPWWDWSIVVEGELSTWN